MLGTFGNAPQALHTWPRRPGFAGGKAVPPAMSSSELRLVALVDALSALCLTTSGVKRLRLCAAGASFRPSRAYGWRRGYEFVHRERAAGAYLKGHAGLVYPER